MTSIKTLWVALVVIAIIALGAYFYPRMSGVELTAGTPNPTTNLDSLAIGNGGLSVNGEMLFNNQSASTTLTEGLHQITVQQEFVATSSAVCSIANPFTGTSTLVSFIAKIRSGILGANTFDLSTSTTAYASSSPAFVQRHSVGSNSLDWLVWYPNSATTSPGVLPGVSALGESYDFVAPNLYVTYKVATTTPSGTFTGGYWKGTCTATFQAP